MRLQTFNEAFDPTQQEEVPELEAVDTVETMPIVRTQQTVVCDRFSDDNKNATVSSCKRSVKLIDNYRDGYCFLDHPKIEKYQILKWSLRVPKFHKYGFS